MTGRNPFSLTSRKASFTLMVASVFVTWMLLELLLAFVLRDYKTTIQGRLLDETQTAHPNPTDEDAFARDHFAFILHPYLGFIGDYTKDHRFNRYGFFGPDPLIKRSDDRIIVAISGGSVAQLFYEHSHAAIASELKRSIPAFSHKTVEVVSIALGGFKQPQQLIGLTYFLALGGHFDIVINLDGFNELALPYTDNVPNRVATSFPRAWYFFSRKGLDVDNLGRTAGIMALQEKRQHWKRTFSSAPQRNSLFFLMLWDLIDRRTLAEERSIERDIQQSLSKDNLPHQVTGPFIQPKDRRDSLVESVDLWKKSSLQMAKISQANGIEYFHFLQPNQYFPGTKKFSEEETRIAFAKEPYSYRDAAKDGYDLLIEAGNQLKKDGVDFHDLTTLFKNEERTIYIDTCCHMNERGNDALAKDIVKVIADFYNARPLRVVKEPSLK